jgi:hypothetical protein
LCQIFYKHDEIKSIKAKQQADHFKDLLKLKKDAIETASVIGVSSRINIASYAPKLKVNEK